MSEEQDMTTPEAREAYYKQNWEIATARVRELMAERAPDPRVERLVAALRFFADASNYEPNMIDIFATMPADLRTELAAIARNATPSESADTNAARELITTMLVNPSFSGAVGGEVARRSRRR